MDASQISRGDDPAKKTSKNLRKNIRYSLANNYIPAIFSPANFFWEGIWDTNIRIGI